MEDQHDVQCVEFGPSDGERQADEDRMKHDPKLEDEDGCHLRRIVLHRVAGGNRRIRVLMLPGMSQVIVAWRMSTGR